jgi:hypothetical protein
MDKLIKKLLRESILKSQFKGRNILYHSTFIDKVLKIITDNKIEPRTTQKILTKFNGESREFNGVSLTRNINLNFSDIQLILDGDAIKRDFGKRLVPHDYFAQFGTKTKSDSTRSDWNESEEFFIGTLEPISKYLLGIRFTTSSGTIEDFKISEPEIFYQFKEKIGNIPFYDSNFNQINL